MLLILRQFAFTNMGETIVLVVLGEVQANLFTIGRDAHGNKAIDEFVAQPTHGKRIDKHDDDGQEMEEENDETFPRAGDETFLNEDTRQHGAEDTTRAVGGEDIECIVDATMRAPIDGNIADERDDESNENALTNRDIASRWRDGHKTYHTSHCSTHGSDKLIP